MSAEHDDLNAIPEDLTTLSVNFPPRPRRELYRGNVINTLQSLLGEAIFAASVEGADGMGKTTILSQFVRRFPAAAISLFISPANRLSYDIDLIRLDIATQAHWVLTRKNLRRDQYDPLLLKTYYGDLQRYAKQSKSTIYFVLDGIEDLEKQARGQLLQQLTDSLPIGIPQFRFLFSGDDGLYKELIGPNLIIKSYPLTEFSAEEARAIFEGHALSLETVSDLNELCRGIPGRLASVRRALEIGTSAEDLLQDAPNKWPEFFEADWRQVNQQNEQLIKVLALLAHDLKPHTVSDISGVFNIFESEVISLLATVNFLHVDSTSGAIHFASAGLLNFIADRLKDRKPHIQKLLIKRLLANPSSPEALLDLPGRLEEAAAYPDLVELLTPDHLLQVLERTQTLSKVGDTVQRGFRSAKKLGRDADLLRFGLQQSIIAEIATADTWESEIAALAAVRHDKEALALANSAVLREDRLLMLTTLAHGMWLRGDTVQPELLESIRLLIDNLDYWSLGQRAGNIGSKLTCVSPDLATAILKKARWGTDDTTLDRAFVSLTVSALTDIKDASRRDEAMDIVARSRRDPKAKGILEGVRVLSGRVAPENVRARVKEIESTDAQISLLRYWCVLNSSEVGADSVAQEAIRIALSAPSSRLDASLLADLSRAVAGGPTVERKKELIGMLDGVRGTAERLGPSVDYVRLQLFLALAEAEFDTSASEGRLKETFEYIARIGDMPSRGEAYAAFLGTIRKLPSSMSLRSGTKLDRSCTDELEGVVLTLSEATADHYISLGDIITGLCPGDVSKALDYTKVVNTEHRRNAVLLDVVEALLRRTTSDIDPNELKQVLESITSNAERDQAVLHVLERLADAPVGPEKLKGLLPIISMVETMAESVSACRAFVCAIKILAGSSALEKYQSLKERLTRELTARWGYIDVEWLRIDVGFGIVRDLAAIDSRLAESILKAVDLIKAESGISAPRPASAFVACVRLVVRALCGLLPRRLETETDLQAIAALIDVIPAHGERAALWADLCMRAAISGRSDLAERLVKQHCLPAFQHIPAADNAYRAAVLIQIAPAVYRAQPATCIELLEALDPEDRDVALREVIRFVLFDRVPFDPLDRSTNTFAEVTYEKLLQVETLTRRLETDWMIYSTSRDIAALILSPMNRFALAVPQKEDIARRFRELTNAKLPIARQISHHGFRIATLAQILRFTQAKSADWTYLVEEAKALTNVADRVYVLQIVALALPKGMSSVSTKLLEQAKGEIREIPSVLDQIERYLGLAEDVSDFDSSLCRELVNQAAVAIRESSQDVHEQRRRLVDIAHRLDVDYAKRLIDEFDDDDAKRRAQGQVRLLEVRKAIKEDEGKLEEEKVLSRVRSVDVSRLGALLLEALNSRRVQTYHPSELRGYLDIAAEQPLKRAYSVLVWYVENGVSRFSSTEHASTFLRPIFDACVVGAQMAGQVAGRAMVRLKAVRTQAATQLATGRSLLATPKNREEAVRLVTSWFERNLADSVLLHDPYFGPDELEWVQAIRTAKANCEITVMTARGHQPTQPAGTELEDLYSTAWRRRYDQIPPKTEISIIGGERSKESPIHDRWLVSGATGLRFGTSLNSLGMTKDSEVSELTPEDAAQKRAEMLQYLTREKAEHNGEKLRLIRFWL